MFNKIIISNILGINNRIEIDFLATPKKKGKKDSIYELEPYVNINKIIGIIGPNASGKSSIVDALSELKIFLSQYKIIDKARERKDEEFLKFINNNSDFLPDRNLEHLDEMSEITIEVYIPTGEMPGFYKYSIIYNNDTLNEKLYYRKKIKSKKEIEIENYTTDTKRSDIGYKCYYKDSIIKDYESVGKELVDKFNKTLRYYDTFYNYIASNSIIQLDINFPNYIGLAETVEYIKENKKIMLKFLNTIDKRITGILFEKNENGDDEIYFQINHKAKIEWYELSTGTKRIIKLFVSVMQTLNNGGIMLCDEIETALHKELVQLIINLFLNSKSPSQLIFTTHLPEILDQSEIRNDQKYFLHYNNGKSELINIANINPRNDYSFSKNYYIDKRFMPQPSKENIEELCRYIEEEEQRLNSLYEITTNSLTGDIMWKINAELISNDDLYKIIDKFIATNMHRDYNLSIFDNISKETMEIETKVNYIPTIVNQVYVAEHAAPVTFIGINFSTKCYVVGMSFSKGKYEFGEYRYRDGKLERKLN